MTNLDRAFIKAFAKQKPPAGGPHALPVPAKTGSPHASEYGASEEQERHGKDASWYRVQSGSAVHQDVPPPHLDLERAEALMPEPVPSAAAARRSDPPEVAREPRPHDEPSAAMPDEHRAEGPAASAPAWMAAEPATPVDAEIEVIGLVYVDDDEGPIHDVGCWSYPEGLVTSPSMHSQQLCGPPVQPDEFERVAAGLEAHDSGSHNYKTAIPDSDVVDHQVERIAAEKPPSGAAVDSPVEQPEPETAESSAEAGPEPEPTQAAEVPPPEDNDGTPGPVAAAEPVVREPSTERAAPTAEQNTGAIPDQEPAVEAEADRAKSSASGTSPPPQDAGETDRRPWVLAEAAPDNGTSSHGSARPPAPEERPRLLVPAWEVDRLRWPVLCDRLEHAVGRRISKSGMELAAASEDGLRIMAVTGTRRGEGRTTVSLCVARAAAAVGVNVALVDGDFQNPQLAQALRLNPPHGWNEVIAGRAALEEAAVFSLEDRVTVFSQRRLAGVSVDWSHRQAADTLAAIAGHFDLVVVDLSPGLAENLELLEIDAALVLRDTRNSPLAAAQEEAARLRQGGVQAVGIVENFLNQQESRSRLAV